MLLSSSLRPVYRTGKQILAEFALSGHHFGRFSTIALQRLGICMSIYFIALPIIHLALIGLAIAGVAGSRPGRQFAGAIFLAATALSAWLMSSITSQDGWQSAVGGLLLGPFVAPVYLIAAFAEAPFWGAVLVVFCVVVTIATWQLMKRKKWRHGASAVLAGVLATWLAGEASVEITMRTQAALQFDGYCNYRRVSTPSMLANGLSDWLPSAHASLSDREANYVWSFRENRWVYRNSCDQKPCWCYRGSHGLPNVPRLPN